LDYRFIDASAPNGLSYYRLRTVDTNGSEVLSPVITVLRDKDDLVIYPVPVQNELRWSLPGTNPTRAIVLDAMGRSVIDVRLTMNAITGRSIQKLSAGSYTLVLLDEHDGILARSRFVKD
jgi:hypothetical protein